MKKQLLYVDRENQTTTYENENHLLIVGEASERLNNNSEDIVYMLMFKEIDFPPMITPNPEFLTGMLISSLLSTDVVRVIECDSFEMAIDLFREHVCDHPLFNRPHHRKGEQ